jgi:hypothetical protein
MALRVVASLKQLEPRRHLQSPGDFLHFLLQLLLDLLLRVLEGRQHGSSTISASSGFSRRGSIFSARISPLPFKVTRTAPAPDCPSASMADISSCICCMRDCSSCACFIIFIRSFIAGL